MGSMAQGGILNTLRSTKGAFPIRYARQAWQAPVWITWITTWILDLHIDENIMAQHKLDLWVHQYLSALQKPFPGK